MYGRVATRAPARAQGQKNGVILLSDEPAAARALHLRMTFQAKVRIAFDEQFLVDRAVRSVANRAPFPQGLVFKYEGPGLLAMTLRAAFVQPRHRQSAVRFHDVAAVRIVALHAVHPVFNDRVMLRQVELRVDFKMALKAGRRVFAGIDDEFAAPAPDTHMLAPRSVARLATGRRRPFQVVLVKPRVRARRKDARDVAVALRAHFVANEVCAFNLGRFHDGPVKRGTRAEKHNAQANQRQRDCRNKPSPVFHRLKDFPKAAGYGEARFFVAPTFDESPAQFQAPTAFGTILLVNHLNGKCSACRFRQHSEWQPGLRPWLRPSL